MYAMHSGLKMIHQNYGEDHHKREKKKNCEGKITLIIVLGREAKALKITACPSLRQNLGGNFPKGCLF